MIFRCRHPRWNPVLVNYQPPRTGPKSIEATKEKLILAVMFGLSTVTQTCARCGRARSYTVAGDARQVAA